MNRRTGGFSLAAVSLLVIVALVAACSPAVGPLGTPATPEPTADQSVPVPSDDATPDLSSPSPLEPSSRPSASAESPGASVTPAPTATPRPTAAPAGSTIVRAYFVLGSFTDNAGLAPVLREVPQTKAVATAAVRALLEGPVPAEMAVSPAMYTAIPDDTTLLGVTIGDEIATVDLSKEFESGGGSESMLQRLAQVVYTLTQFPTVDGVLFELDGVPTTVFGGEGVTFPPEGRPIVRKDFRDELPAIFVDRPAWGASLGNPGVVSGIANVFEATFRVELRDGAGRTLVGRQVTASCGTGCWGDFKTTLSYTVAKAQWGTLRVFDLSAKDGAIENLTEYRVWLTPGG
jgi:germination protein M